MHVKFRERWYDGTRIRGLKSVADIYLGYIFDNREMAEGEKLDIRKVSKYTCIQVSRKLDARPKLAQEPNYSDMTADSRTPSLSPGVPKTRGFRSPYGTYQGDPI